MLDRPDYATIRDRAIATVETRLTGADARLPKSDLEVNSHVLAEAISGLYDFGLRIADQILPDTADPDQLEMIAADWGITRQPAIAATGAVTLTLIGAPGAVVPAGTRLQCSGQDYITAADVTVLGPTALVSVAALAAGAAGNQVAGLSISLVSPVDGIQTRAVTGEITGGIDIEDDAGLLSRLLLRMRRPPQGGCRDDYQAWARQVPGVTRAWVFSNTPARGIVTVLVARDGNAGGPIPSVDEVAEVQAYLDQPDVRPVQAEVIVLAPVPVAHDLVIAIEPNTAEVRAEAETRIRAFYRAEAAPAVTITPSRLSAAISAAPGEERHRLVWPTADVAHGLFEMATIGSIVFEDYGA